MKYALLTLLLLILFSFRTRAQDRMFAYTYQTNVLGKGMFDLEFQNELRIGKKGNFSPYLFGQHLDQRLELEAGLGKNLQTSFYFNSELFNYADTASTDIEQELKISFSNEWKWKLSDPVANAVGVALYEEFEFGGNNVEFESKLILDKKLSNDLLAFNFTYKFEIEKEVERIENQTLTEWTHNSPIELYFGYMHFFSPVIGVGIEAKNNNDIVQDQGWMNSVWFAGPAFHCSIGNFFINLSALPQIANVHKTDAAPGSRDLNDFEAAEFRVLAGYSF